MQDITSEYLKKYKLNICQPAKGYRYSIDSFLLADFVSKESFQKCIEIGGGCGIISFLISRLNKYVKEIEIFEKQKRLFNCLKQNSLINEFTNVKFKLRNEDARFAIKSLNPDIIYLNPPFYKLNKGKVSPFSEKAFARHEYNLNLIEIFKIFKRWKSENTKLAMIHIFDRKDEIERTSIKFNLNIDKILLIKPSINQIPKHIIYLFSTSSKITKKNETLVYDELGNYTDYMKNLLNSEID